MDKVDLSHIQGVVQLEKSIELKVASTFSDIYISNEHFPMRKVSVSLQLFREAPAEIRYWISQGQLPPQAETIAWYCGLLFDWFTLMSSRRPVVAISHLDEGKYQSAVCKKELAISTFEDIKIVPTGHWKPSQTGLLNFTAAVMHFHSSIKK